MVLSRIDAQAVSRQAKITFLVERFHSMAENPELRGKLHEYFWRLDIDSSVPHYAITHGISPVSDDNLEHVRQALVRADDRRVDGLFDSVSKIPEPVGRRSEAPRLEGAAPV